MTAYAVSNQMVKAGPKAQGHDTKKTLGRKILDYVYDCFSLYGQMMYGRPMADQYENVHYEK